MQARKMIGKVLLFVAAACLGWSVQAATTIVDVADGTTVDIVASGYNGHKDGTDWTPATADTCLRFGKDVTVVLDSTAAKDGVFELFTNIYATNGSFTVEATGINTIHWVGGVQTSGRVLVKGAKRIHFGDLKTFSTGITTRGKSGFSYFNTDVAFENAEAEGLVFTNGVTCAKTPTSCDWSIAAQTRFAVDGDALLGGGAATFALEDYDITLMSAQGIDAGKIVVGEDCTLEVFQCKRTEFQASKGVWSWAGLGSQHLTNDLEFAEGSTFYLCGGQANLYLDGALSGAPTFALAYTAGEGKGIVNVNKSVQLNGTVVFRKTSAQIQSASILKFNKGAGSYSFGDVSVEADAANGMLTGDPSTVVSVNSVSGELDVEGVQLQIRSSAAAGAVVNLKGEGPWTVSGPESGTAAELSGVLVPETAGGTIALGGKLSLGDLGDRFAVLNLLEGAELSDTSFGAATVITGKGKVVYAGASWKDKIYLWTDGSKVDSIVQLDVHWPQILTDANCKYKPATAQITSGGTVYPLVWEWADCRGASAGYAIRSLRCTSYDDSADEANAYNTIASNPRPTYPFFASNVNVSATAKAPGYMSFAGSQAGSRNAALVKYDAETESWKPVSVRTPYAIVVFGSQQGGGAGILGTADRSLEREYSQTLEAASNPMFKTKNYAVYADGEAVADSTVTGLNGGWQILSIDTEDNKVSGLGCARLAGSYAASSDNRGYSNYAEVMLFSEAPTEIERKVIEEHLAEKWGLPCAHSGTAESVALNVAVGGAASSVPLAEYGADDIPRVFTLNVNVPQDFKRDVKYPIVKCADTDAVTLGTVTGKPMQGLTIVREGGIAYLYAPKIGLLITVK